MVDHIRHQRALAPNQRILAACQAVLSLLPHPPESKQFDIKSESIKVVEDTRGRWRVVRFEFRFKAKQPAAESENADP